MLEDIQELGIVRSPDEDMLLSINNLISAETCATVRLWAQLSWWVIKTLSPFPHPLCLACLFTGTSNACLADWKQMSEEWEWAEYSGNYPLQKRIIPDIIFVFFLKVNLQLRLSVCSVCWRGNNVQESTYVLLIFVVSINTLPGKPNNLFNMKQYSW